MQLEELYTKTMSDEALKKAYMDAVREKKIAEFLAANGCEATEEELQAFLDSKENKTGELADDELDSVAGGGKCGTIYHNKRPVVTASNACEHWKCSRCQSTQYRSTTINSFCRQCGCERGCKNCEFSRYEDALLQCFHPLRYDN